ncbi:hypothetical protein BH09VER1_BH09VER1_51390 [soil metagenome]
MKTFAALVLLLSISLAGAQPAVTNATVTTTTTTTAATTPTEMSGTIVSYNATTCVLVIQVPDVTAPVTYTTNTATALMDYANAPITVDLLKAGQPVTVYSVAAAPATATKVIVRKYTK